jgi:hypothetical protein
MKLARPLVETQMAGNLVDEVSDGCRSDTQHFRQFRARGRKLSETLQPSRVRETTFPRKPNFSPHAREEGWEVSGGFRCSSKKPQKSAILCRKLGMHRQTYERPQSAVLNAEMLEDRRIAILLARLRRCDRRSGRRSAGRPRNEFWNFAKNVATFLSRGGIMNHNHRNAHPANTGARSVVSACDRRPNHFSNAQSIQILASFPRCPTPALPPQTSTRKIAQ